jgi:hypothetical protein
LTFPDFVVYLKVKGVTIMARRSKAEKAVDAVVEAAYQRHFDRVPVNMMDLPKIMNVGRTALAEGRDIDAAMAAAVPQFRQDR